MNTESLGLEYKTTESVFEEVTGEVPYLKVRILEETGLVRSGFSTRLGGVSQAEYASMNLSFTRGDDPECVKENFRRIGEAMGIPCEKMVYSRQTHTTNVRMVTEADAGYGVTRERPYTDVDGLVTNVPGICLVTSYADCVPLYFLDPKKKVIGLSHSGWRGTVGKMGQVTVRRMQEEYGCDPADILAAVGPSICQDCYEVSEDVIEQFRQNFTDTIWDKLFYRKSNGKYQLNLWEANRQVFLEAGIRPEHMTVTNVCTRCNSKILYSHRVMGERRGNLCAFLQLKP